MNVAESPGTQLEASGATVKWLGKIIPRPDPVVHNKSLESSVAGQPEYERIAGQRGNSAARSHDDASIIENTPHAIANMVRSACKPEAPALKLRSRLQYDTGIGTRYKGRGSWEGRYCDVAVFINGHHRAALISSTTHFIGPLPVKLYTKHSGCEFAASRTYCAVIDRSDPESPRQCAIAKAI